MLKCALAVLVASLATATQMPVIIDTDAGSDDLMAIAFLLARPDVHIEAITIANGLAHVPKGAANVLRLLTVAGHPEIPVYLGSQTPLYKTAEFPKEWRRIADDLPESAVAGRQTPSGRAARRCLSRTPPGQCIAPGQYPGVRPPHQPRSSFSAPSGRRAPHPAACDHGRGTTEGAWEPD